MRASMRDRWPIDTTHRFRAVSTVAAQPQLPPPALERILAVTRALAAPFELRGLLDAITEAALQVLQAERASIWLVDPATGELVVEVARDLPPLRVPAGTGLVGLCARERRVINVPDCYADARFNPAVDRASGFRSRSLLALPLVDHQQTLVGVMQVINRAGGPFSAADESLAQALAAQCAVALTRVRMTEAALAAELMRREETLAASVQRSTLPQVLPSVPGYAMHGLTLPAAMTGGDAYDLALTPRGLLLMLADATGHGIAAALSVTQMHAMLKMALRLGADLPSAFRHVNDQLADTLGDGRFVTAFIGLLDPLSHRLTFLSGGQGPILHYHAASDRIEAHRATSFPMGAMPIAQLRPAIELTLAPGDWLLLLSDGIYERANARDEPFGRAPVETLLRQMRDASPGALCEAIVAAVRAFADGQPQDDDMTLVLLRRDAGDPAAT